MEQNFFNISPSSTAFVTCSHFPNSAFTFKLKMSSCSDFLSYESCTPSVILRAVSAMTSAPAQSFENVWPKLLSKCNRYCVTSLIHPQTYPNHHARWSCNHTAPSHSSNPPVLPWVLFPTSFCLICNHLTLHLHNRHLSACSWTAPNSYTVPEPPAMLLLPAAFESAAFLECLASFLAKTRLRPAIQIMPPKENHVQGRHFDQTPLTFQHCLRSPGASGAITFPTPYFPTNCHLLLFTLI